MSAEYLNDKAMDWIDQNRNDIVFRQWHMHMIDNLTYIGTEFKEQYAIAKPQIWVLEEQITEYPQFKIETILYRLITLRMRFGLLPDKADEIFARHLLAQIPPITAPMIPSRFYLSKIYSEMKDDIIYWRAYWAHCNSVNERSDRP